MDMTRDERERQRRKVQKQLDDALEDSFPASDPVSIVTSQEEEYWDESESGTGTEAARDEAKEPSAPASNQPD